MVSAILEILANQLSPRRAALRAGVAFVLISYTMLTKNGMHPRKKGWSLPTREVIVADQQDLSVTTPTSDCPPNTPNGLRDFKVFMKKNLAIESPAPDLLVKIHQRIDQIKLEEQ